MTALKVVMAILVHSAIALILASIFPHPIVAFILFCGWALAVYNTFDYVDMYVAPGILDEEY